jgi:hypothetical protein
MFYRADSGSPDLNVTENLSAIVKTHVEELALQTKED